MNRTAILLLSLVVLSLPFDHQLSVYVSELPKTHLYSIFIRLTELGKAMPYILLSFILYIIFSLAERYPCAPDQEKKMTELANNFGFSFFTFCVTGIMEMTVKMLVGRSRPSEMVDYSSLVFHPFNFDHLFHSFPSGHSQAVFTFAFLVGRKWPALRMPALFYAVVIASTRIVRNVHFLSDVMGGVALAWLGLMLSEWLVDRYYGDFPLNGSTRLSQKITLSQFSRF